jgi:hypothetical protein
VTFDPLTAVHYQRHDPGVHFTKDALIAIDQDPLPRSARILTPNVVHAPSGGYRMYYTGLDPARRDSAIGGHILSASSSDGTGWTKDPGVRVDVSSPYASWRVLSPDVIPLRNGGYRMYFEGRSERRPTVVLSAHSTDGLEWVTEEGSRFGDDRWSYGTPRVLYVHSEDGLVRQRMYLHRYTFPFRPGVDVGNHIISALSDDGVVFDEEPGVRVRQETPREEGSVYAPEVLRRGDGSYRMYYSGWARPIRGGVFTATSANGLLWHKSEDVVVELGGPWDGDMVSEPCLIDLADGRSRLFYEACDELGGYRILSATSASTLTTKAGADEWEGEPGRGGRQESSRHRGGM